MRRVACAVVLVLAALTGAAQPAQAEAGACVNPGEFGQVHKGMTKHRVHRIFDTRGRQIAFSRHGRFTSEIRRYRGCPNHSTVSIGYGNGRVRSKSASW